jgi:hypothetical protein
MHKGRDRCAYKGFRLLNGLAIEAIETSAERITDERSNAPLDG